MEPSGTSEPRKTACVAGSTSGAQSHSPRVGVFADPDGTPHVRASGVRTSPASRAARSRGHKLGRCSDRVHRCPGGVWTGPPCRARRLRHQRSDSTTVMVPAGPSPGSLLAKSPPAQRLHGLKFPIGAKNEGKAEMLPWHRAGVASCLSCRQAPTPRRAEHRNR